MSRPAGECHVKESLTGTAFAPMTIPMAICVMPLSGFDDGAMQESVLQRPWRVGPTS